MNIKPTNLINEIERREDINSFSPFPVYETEIIKDLKIRQNMITKSGDFNNVPVTYCKNCLSLNIKTVEFPKTSSGEDRDVDYCIACGNTDMEKAHIEEWEDIYEEKYGERFLNKPTP